MKDPLSQDYVLAIVGCGAMGQGIAQVSAQAGMRVLMMDAREGAAAKARDAVSGRLDRLVEKGRMGEADAQAATALLEPVDTLEALASADCVVEAIIEDRDAKQSVFKALEDVVREDCIIASNTSSIPLASIASACRVRDRIAGLHFFNPVPLMKLVEVIRAAETSDETVETLMTLGRRMTRTPVAVKDSPGFLVNMGGRAYTTEALQLEHQGIATPAQVDAVMRDCWGFRMGPFELMDLTGIDVNYPVSLIVYDGYNQDPRLRTAPNHKAMYDAGLYGRKTGRGWYAYDKGQPLDRPSPDYEVQGFVAQQVRLVEPTECLRRLAAEAGLMESETGPFLAAPIGECATSFSMRTGVDPRMLLCVDTTGDTSKRLTVMCAPGADRDILEPLVAGLNDSGRKITWINDSPGFIGQRMVSMIANLGCYMAEIGLASPEDIDMAMQLGLNYPYGSIGLAREFGPARTYKVMQSLQNITGDPRYRPTLWLKRRALLGLSLYTPH